jgi:hypothetical protein
MSESTPGARLAVTLRADQRQRWRNGERPLAEERPVRRAPAAAPAQPHRPARFGYNNSPMPAQGARETLRHGR